MSGAVDIGVGIIGASPGRSWAAMSHIPALQALSGYRLRAVATGSAASAERAGTEFGVDGFDDPRALIEHPLVDLVVVAVKVTHHQQLVSQALAAGKMVFCEWPLGVDADEAQSITDEAVRAGVPTVVGLQSRFTAGVRQAAELVRSGHLGRVVSTSIVGSGLAWRRVTDPSHAYMYDGRSGATTLTVPAAHALDALSFVLGETIRYTAAFGLSSPYVEVAGEAEALTVTAPDQIALTAELASGAVASVFYRGGSSRAANLRWEINGTDGDLLLTSPSGNGNIQIGDLALAAGQGADTKIVEIELPSPTAEVVNVPPGPAVAVAELYAAFARDLRNGTQDAPTFVTALQLHRALAGIERGARWTPPVEVRSTP